LKLLETLVEKIVFLLGAESAFPALTRVLLHAHVKKIIIQKLSVLEISPHVKYFQLKPPVTYNLKLAGKAKCAR